MCSSDLSYSNLPPGSLGAEETAEALLQFFADRLNAHLRSEGVKHDHISAVFSIGQEDDLVQIVGRISALGEFLASEDGDNLLTAYRRAANISSIEAKKDQLDYDGSVDPSLLSEREELDLHKALELTRPSVEDHLAAGRFQETMSALATLRNPVDNFFDKVTVNSDDPKTRINRLHLLSSIVTTMGSVANFGEIQG